ncbi:MAG: sigma-70 family RNA polymerase sigma factor [Myxococcota bacterium]|nr:sigma-70 family RNA polymerase sigma factor [Myxococcota bacterium]
MRDVIVAEVQRFVAWGRRVGLDVDDLIQIAEGAAVEAAATWKADRGRKQRTWAGRIIRQRLVEALDQEAPATEPEVPSGPVGGDPLGGFDRFVPADEVAEQHARARTLERAISTLRDRRQHIVREHLKGRTFEQIGDELGVGHQFVAREHGKAVDEMRAWSEGLQNWAA